MKMKRLRTNTIILLVAMLFSVALFYFVENPNLFSASILSLKDAQIMIENHRDLAYKNEHNVLDVYISDTIKDINENSVSIIYNELDVQIDLDKIKAQTDYEILSQTTGMLILKFKNFN
jgi:ABC-type oligopeptide transport system substrate-binding subunit